MDSGCMGRAGHPSAGRNHAEPLSSSLTLMSAIPAPPPALLSALASMTEEVLRKLQQQIALFAPCAHSCFCE